MSEKDTYLATHAREAQITLGLLKAFPEDKADLRPHPKSRSAKELGFVLANQELFSRDAANGAMDPSLFGNQPPATMAEIVALFEKNAKDVEDTIRSKSDAELSSIGNFFGHDMRRLDAMWANMFDHCHHRGQFSVYVRLSDAKVPSIYGPSADTAQAAG